MVPGMSVPGVGAGDVGAGDVGAGDVGAGDVGAGDVGAGDGVTFNVTTGVGATGVCVGAGVAACVCCWLNVQPTSSRADITNSAISCISLRLYLVSTVW